MSLNNVNMDYMAWVYIVNRPIENWFTVLIYIIYSRSHSKTRANLENFTLDNSNYY